MIPNKKLVSGKALQSSAALGTFCEYILVKSCQVDKIDQSIKLDNLSPITCTAANAFGASRNIANVVSGSSVAVWGSCAFGLNTMFGAKLNGAKNIITIDVHNDRKRLAQKFGCTEFINPQELDKPVNEYLLEKYGGVDYAFDCNGEPSKVPDEFKSLTPFGTFAFVALTHSGTQVVQPTWENAFDKKILGGFFGNRLSADMYEELLCMYKEGKYDLDSMETHKFKLDQINDAIESVSSGKNVKTVITFD